MSRYRKIIIDLTGHKISLEDVSRTRKKENGENPTLYVETTPKYTKTHRAVLCLLAPEYVPFNNNTRGITLEMLNSTEEICSFCVTSSSFVTEHLPEIETFQNFEVPHKTNGRPGRNLESDSKTKNQHKTPHSSRERTPRHRDIPEIAVWCHPRKTSQLTAEPEELPQR